VRLELAGVGVALLALAVAAPRVPALWRLFGRIPAVIVLALLALAIPFGTAERCAGALLHATDEHFEPDHA